MTRGVQLVVYPVSDVAKAKALLTGVLGEEPYVDTPYYVGFRVGAVEIGIDPNGRADGQTAPIAYFDVEDINSSVDELVKAGAEVQRPVSDVGAGLLVAVVRDGDGNPIGLRQSP